jgi:pSer/pThr/pTyr-binding forkhead associated (FHA) protein
VTNSSLAQFTEACGGSRILCLHVEDQSRQEPLTRILQQPYALVGRDPRADLLLSHGEVSPRHVYFQKIAGRVFCVDLESRTGTHWPGGRRPSGWLDYGQALRVGPYLIRPALDHDGTPPPTRSQLDASAAKFLEANDLPEVTLEFINKLKAPAWRMTPLLALVGRSSECRVHLVGRSVSSYHCCLLRTPLGVWIVDLFGRGGISVNDLVVRCARLDQGDRIQIGRFLIRVHYESPPLTNLRCHWQLVPAPDDRPPGDSSTGSSDLDPIQARVEPPEMIPEPEVTASPVRLPVTVPNGNLVPISIDLPGEQSAVVEALLVPITRQLNLMQQQMFDQFQQGMMMMFQMFNTLHRDQLNLLREEMEKLHELTEEIHLLQTELSLRSKQSDRNQPEAAAASVKESSPSAAAAAGSTRSDNGSGKTAMSSRTPVSPTKEPAGSSEAGSSGGAPAQKQEAAGISGQEVSREAIDAPTKARPDGPATPKPRAVLPKGLPDEEMHAWLNRRIRSIQEERQTRWQKILAFLTAK